MRMRIRLKNVKVIEWLIKYVLLVLVFSFLAVLCFIYNFGSSIAIQFKVLIRTISIPFKV